MNNDTQELHNQIAALKIRAFDAQEHASQVEGQVKALSNILHQICEVVGFEVEQDGSLKVDLLIEHLASLAPADEVETEEAK